MRIHRHLLLRKYKITVYACLMGIVILINAHFLDWQIFERISQFLHSLEEYQIDELVIASLILFIGIFIDVLRNAIQDKHLIEIQQQRLRVLKATMTTVHDIMNNFLNSMVLFRVQAQKTQTLNPESIDMLNGLIRDTAQKIVALSDMDDTPEKKLAAGKIGIDYEKKSELKHFDSSSISK